MGVYVCDLTCILQKRPQYGVWVNPECFCVHSVTMRVFYPFINSHPGKDLSNNYLPYFFFDHAPSFTAQKIGTFNKLNLLATCLMRSTQSFSFKLSSICFVSFTHVYRTAVFACNRLQILINFFFPHSSLYISDSFRYTSCTGIYGRIAFPKLPYLELLPKHSLTTIPFTSNCPHS